MCFQRGWPAVSLDHISVRRTDSDSVYPTCHATPVWAFLLLFTPPPCLSGATTIRSMPLLISISLPCLSGLLISRGVFVRHKIGNQSIQTRQPTVHVCPTGNVQPIVRTWRFFYFFFYLCGRENEAKCHCKQPGCLVKNKVRLWMKNCIIMATKLPYVMRLCPPTVIACTHRS